MENVIEKSNKIYLKYFRKNASTHQSIITKKFNGIGGLLLFLSDWKDENINADCYYVVQYKDEIFSSKKLDSVSTFINAFNFKESDFDQVIIQEFDIFTPLKRAIKSVLLLKKYFDNHKEEFKRVS